MRSIGRSLRPFLTAVGLIAIPALASHPGHAAGPNNAAVVDARRDPRLARKLVLRAEGVPVAHVVRRLSAQTGVTLSVSGRTGDERLVAFTHDAPLGEIMLAIADLYRLQWTRGGSETRPAYALSQRPAEAMADRNLRRDVFRRVLERLHAAIAAAQNPAPIKTHDLERRELRIHTDALRAAAFRLAAVNWDRLMQEGYLEIPIASLPPAERDRIVPHLAPLRDHSARQEEDLRLQRIEFNRRMNMPIRKEDEQPNPEVMPLAHSFRLSFSIPNGGQLQILLWSERGGPVLNDGKAEALPEVGIELYTDRPLRPSTAAAPTPGPLAAPLALPPLPPIPSIRTGAEEGASISRTPPGGRPLGEVDGVPHDWISRLSLLSDASGISIYSDYYGGGPIGRDGIPLKAAGKGTVAEALDALCKGRYIAGADWYFNTEGESGSFWWPRSNAALIRSRRWLWEAETLVPVATIDRLLAAVREKRALTALEFPALAALPRYQRDLGGTAPGANETWKYGVLLPARLSPASRGLALGAGLTSENLPAVDRPAFGALLPPRPEGGLPAYSARVRPMDGADPRTGMPQVEISVEVTLDGKRQMTRYPIPVPYADSRDLLVAGARPAATRKPERLVMALYFPWYGLEAVSGRQRNLNKVDLNARKIGNFAHFPASGPYDSTDEAVVGRHMTQLKEAGIDVLVCSWWGPDEFSNDALRKLMPQAKAAGLRVCLLLEAWKPLTTPEQTAADLTAWLKAFKDEDVYLKVDGKPVLFVQNVMKGRQPLQGWADTLARMEQAGGVFAVSLRGTRAEASVFQGLHTAAMVPRGLRDVPVAMRGWMEKQVEAARGWGRGRPGAVVAAVTPGFDMRPSNSADLFVGRDRGRVYRDSWEAALNQEADWVLINSFNQWQIGTEIEPSDQHGDLYLRLTAEYAQRFKNLVAKLTK